MSVLSMVKIPCEGPDSGGGTVCVCELWWRNCVSVLSVVETLCEDSDLGSRTVCAPQLVAGLHKCPDSGGRTV